MRVVDNIHPVECHPGRVGGFESARVPVHRGFCMHSADVAEHLPYRWCLFIRSTKDWTPGLWMLGRRSSMEPYPRQMLFLKKENVLPRIIWLKCVVRLPLQPSVLMVCHHFLAEENDAWFRIAQCLWLLVGHALCPEIQFEVFSQELCSLTAHSSARHHELVCILYLQRLSSHSKVCFPIC